MKPRKVPASPLQGSFAVAFGFSQIRQTAEMGQIETHPAIVTNGMVDLIHVTAKEANVDLFERFAVMRYWRLTEDIPFSPSARKACIRGNEAA